MGTTEKAALSFVPIPWPMRSVGLCDRNFEAVVQVVRFALATAELLTVASVGPMAPALAC